MRCAALLCFATLLQARTAPPTDPPATASIRGTVKDAYSGDALPNVYIHVAGEKINLRATNVVGDEDGKFSIANLPAGTFTLSARGVTRTVKLEEAQEVTFDLLLPGNPSLSGRVLDQDQKPVPDAPVWVIDSHFGSGALHHRAIGPQTTGKDGSFTFEGCLDAGRTYYLLASRPLPDNAALHKPVPFDERQPIEASTYHGDVTALDAATAIRLRPGEHREHADIKIRRTASLCVDGKLEVGGRPASLPFNIFDAPLSETQVGLLRANSSSDGGFHVCDLPPGDYRISVDVGYRQTATAGFTIGNSDVHKFLFAYDTVPLHLQLVWDGDPLPVPPSKDGEKWTVTIDGRQLEAPQQRYDSLLQFLDRTNVYLTDVMNGHTEFASEKPPHDGPFRSELPPGDYQVSAAQPGAYVKQVEYNGVALGGGPLHLEAGTRGTLRIVMSAGGATLRCKASETASILLIPPGAVTPAVLSTLVVNTRMEREHIFADIAPGKHRAIAIDRLVGSDPEDLDKLAFALFKATEVEIGPKATLDVNLQAISID